MLLLEAPLTYLLQILKFLFRFMLFENKVLRKIFGAKRDEITGEWRMLRNAELHA